MLQLLVSLPLVALPLQSAFSATSGAKKPTAEQMLERSRAAAAAIDTAHYHAVITRQLLLSNRIWRGEGIVDLDREHARLRVDGNVRMPTETEPSPARLAADGADWVFLDDSAGRWYAGEDAGIGGDGSLLLAQLSLDALLGHEPYADERPIGLRGPDAIGGGEFWILDTISIGGTRTSTWYLSTQDLLPRQCDRVTPLDQGEELIERILHGTIEGADDSAWAPLVPGAGMTRVEAHEESKLSAALLPPRTRDVAVTPLIGSVNPLRDAFEAARGKQRVIALFAPT